MTDDQIRITLVGNAISKIGTEYIYKGDLPGCEGCRMFKVCNNLIPKRRYRIVGIKNEDVHSCNIHYGSMCAVEVIESPIETLIEVKKAILNSEIIFKPSCTETGCRYYDICMAEGLIEGDRYLISSISEDFKPECIRGKTLKKVELSNISD